MWRTTGFMFAAVLLVSVTQADAQGRRNDQYRRNRQEVARAQGVPPGQLPPADRCRVWYDNRPTGRQPDSTSCRQAETIAARDRNARVIYGEDVYDDRSGYGYGSSRYPGTWRGDDDDDRAVSRPGRNRDPRISGGIYDRSGPYNGRNSRYNNGAAFQNGYRDGLNKGREDGEDNDRYDPNRHSWYRSATRGYEDEYGARAGYQARYREGFEAGYSEGYRVYVRR
jgi:hypothetical protein